MDTDQPQPKIELEVKNFGPIAEAKIDLRPLTVFVGPSNTGKTYLATLLYALHNSFAGRVSFWSGPFRRFPGGHLRLGYGDLDESEEEQFASWVNSLPQSPPDENGAGERSSVLPQEIEDIIVEMLGNEASDGSGFHEELARCFGFGKDIGVVVREGSLEPANVGLRFYDNRRKLEEPIIEWSAKLADSGTHATFSRRNTIGFTYSAVQGWKWVQEVGADFYELDWLDAQERLDRLSSLSRSVAAILLPQVIGCISSPAHYLPADRAGVMHAHRSIVAAIVRSAPSAALQPMGEVPAVSGVVADFLERLISINDRRRRFGEADSSGSAERIEADILDGAIEQELTESRYPTYYFRPSGWERNIPLLNTSSMVTELAPVVLFARNLLGPGQTLLIDEPESHLHPARQTEFASILAQLVNSGVRVIVTTHSNWIVDQIATLVRLSELSAQERADLPGSDAALAVGDVGAWAFQLGRGEGGSRVAEMRFDSDGIGFDPGYLAIADAQYSTWAKVGNRLADREVQ